jgi:tRNA(fMet)-specific endonuclease VapC
MNGKYLLDTNIVIALFANDVGVQVKLSAAREVLIPNTVFGELYYGAHKSGRTEANIQCVDELLASSAVLDSDGETARYYATVKNNLRLKGKPIPENDIWIAALALQHDLILVTRDAHFQEVQNLTIESW